MARRAQSAFTLVELLVVMAVVSIMAALLLPALESAMVAAHKLSCLNNLRQLGVATGNYGTDYDGYLPMLWTGYNASWDVRMAVASGVDTKLGANQAGVRFSVLSCPFDRGVDKRPNQQRRSYKFSLGAGTQKSGATYFKALEDGWGETSIPTRTTAMRPDQIVHEDGSYRRKGIVFDHFFANPDIGDDNLMWMGGGWNSVAATVGHSRVYENHYDGHPDWSYNVLWQDLGASTLHADVTTIQHELGLYLAWRVR